MANLSFLCYFSLVVFIGFVVYFLLPAELFYAYVTKMWINFLAKFVEKFIFQVIKKLCLVSRFVPDNVPSKSFNYQNCHSYHAFFGD